ncbi:MAG: hypothetical protein KGN16_05320 [Burkholderiales bacterium]|nr:hypothetical protein [Burkholderiales bacterium]
MSTRWWTLIVWALAAASAAFWGLRLFVTPHALAVPAPLAQTAVVARTDLTRLLGVDAPPPQAVEAAADARFHLVGVVAPRGNSAAAQGLALIAIDGKPARAYRVGAVVDGQNVLQKVGPRDASLGPRGGAALVALNIPPPAPAATGTMPGAMPGLPSQPGAVPVYTPPPTPAPPQVMTYTPPTQSMPPRSRRGMAPPHGAPQAETTNEDGGSQPDNTR